MTTDPALTKVFWTRSGALFELAKSELDGAGIAYLERGRGYLSDEYGGKMLLVRSEDAADAREVLAGLGEEPEAGEGEPS